MTAQLFAQFLHQFRYIIRHGLFTIIYSGFGRKIIGTGRKTIIIYNPCAGKLRGKGHIRLERAAGILARAGHDPVLVATTGPRTACPLAQRALAEGAELILAAGGDGTINEVAEGMIGSRVPLGVLPAGTANVLATETGLGSRLEAAAAALARCEPVRIAAGRLHYADDTPGVRHFLCMAGAGLDARVVHRLNLPFKARLGRFGKLAYWTAGLSLAGRALDQFQAEIEGRAYPCSFALASRVRNYGGDLRIAPTASLRDDSFEVVLFEGTLALRYAKYLAGALAGRVAGMRGVTVLRANRVCLLPPAQGEVHIQIDGEYAGRLPASVEIVPDALTLLIPGEYR